MLPVIADAISPPLREAFAEGGLGEFTGEIYACFK